MRYRLWLRSTALTVLAIGALASGACAARSVNQILADPSRYRNREVRVSGSVVESYAFASRGAYRIDLPAGLGSGLVMMESSHKARD